MTDLNEFKPWPKIPRFSGVGMVITEKIDGTNAQLIVREDGTVQAGSRTRFLTPEQDNFGFAKWVQEHASELAALGAGRYYGEWYGQGIQRGYGLDHKRLALFYHGHHLPACCQAVPVLYHGEYSKNMIDVVHKALMDLGSAAVPGWDKPEGVVITLLGNTDKHKITDIRQGAK